MAKSRRITRTDLKSSLLIIDDGEFARQGEEAATLRLIKAGNV
jgi:hypothetical protein